MQKRVADMSEEERERVRARDRERYQRKRAKLLADPAALQQFREEGRSANRRFRENHRDDPGRKEREAAKDRDQRRADRDAINQKERARYAAEGDAIRARNRAYYWKNRAKRAAYNKARYDALAKEFRAAQRRRNRDRFANDPAAVLAYNREWRRKNPERARLYVRLSGHKRRSAAGSAHWTRAEWLELLGRHGDRCYYCGVQGALHADHRTPLSRGGANTIDNIVPCCKSCNSRKHNRTDDEFRVDLEERAKRRESA